MKKSIWVWVILSIIIMSCNARSQRITFLGPPGLPFKVGNRPVDIALGDLNKDGKLDIVTANAGSGDVTVLLGDGQVSFAPAPKSSFQIGPEAHLIVIGDINRDTNLDLVVSNHHTYGVTVLLGDGKGDFAQAKGSPFIVSNEKSPHNHGLALGDLNEDGNLDIVTSNHGHNNVSVMLGNGKGNFTSAPGSPLTVGKGPYPLTLVDINKDNHLDLITPDLISNTVTVLLGNGKGGFTEALKSPYPVLNRPYFTAVGDVNNDNNLDIITTHDDITRMTILLGNGKGEFKKASNSPFDLKHHTFKVITVDINRDNKTDLVFSNPAGENVLIFLGDGKGDFKPAPGSPFRAGDSPNGIIIGDVNQDGKLDIVTANLNSNDVTVLLGK